MKKNVNTGNIDTRGGNVNIGDTIVQISPEYNEYLSRIDQLEDLNKFCPEGKKKEKYRADLQKITEEFENYKKKIIDLAETFQKIEINTDRLSIAKQYFDAGKFKEAQETLDKEQMSSDLDLLLREKKKLEIKNEDNKKKLRQNSEEFLILAKLADLDIKTTNRFAVVKSLYKKSLEANERFDNLYALALFLQKNCQFSDAKVYYKKILTMYKEQGISQKEEDYINNANALTNLGTILKAQGIHEEAKDAYLRAIDIYTNSCNQGSVKYKHCIAASYQCLGNLFNGTIDHNKAKEYYKKALQSYDDLPDNMYLLEKAILYTNIGTLSFREKDYKKADESYSQALDIYRVLNDTYPDKDFSSNIAGLKNNKAQLALNSGNVSEAERLFFEALEKYKELGKDNFNKEAPNIAGVLGNIGIVFKRQKKYKEAEEYYLEAIALYEQLSESNHEAYEMQIVRISSNLANLYAEQDKREKAIKYYDLSIEKYKLLKNENPIKFTYNLILTLGDYGVFQKKRGNYSMADKLYKEALDLLKQIKETSQNSQMLSFYTGILYTNIASLYMTIGNKNKTIHYVNEAIKCLAGIKKGQKEKESLRVIKDILVDLDENPSTYLRDRGIDIDSINVL